MTFREERARSVTTVLERRFRRCLPAAQRHLAPDLAREAAEVLQAPEAGTDPAMEPRPEWRDALFDAVYDALFVIDPDGEGILEVNARACELLGYTRDELRGLEVADVHPYEMPDMRVFAERVREFGRWQTDELTCRHRCGIFIPAELSATPVRFGGRDALLVSVRDLRQQKLAALGMTVSHVAHDLRNMLGSTQLLSDCLKKVDDPVVQGVLPRLHRSLERANRLCSATLAEGRVREPSPERRRFALAGLVHDVADALGLGHGEGPAWAVEMSDDLQMRADPDQLYRVLLNLLRNALQAVSARSADGDRISLKAIGHDEGAEILISDTGPGLPEGLRERDLTTASRGPWTRGSGLGLAISAELVHAHGGRLEIVETGADGTTFRIWLPFAKAGPKADGTSEISTG